MGARMRSTVEAKWGRMTQHRAVIGTFISVLVSVALCVTTVAAVELPGSEASPAAAPPAQGDGRLSVEPTSAVPGTSLQITGMLPPRRPRVVKLQSDLSGTWKAVDEKRSGERGEFEFEAEMPASGQGSVAFRVVAPRFRVNGNLLRRKVTRVQQVDIESEPSPTPTVTPTATSSPSVTATASPSATATSSPTTTPSGTPEATASTTPAGPGGPGSGPSQPAEPTASSGSIVDGIAIPDEAVTVATAGFALRVPAGTVTEPVAIRIEVLDEVRGVSGNAADFSIDSAWEGVGKSVEITMPLDPDAASLAGSLAPAVIHFPRPGRFEILHGSALSVDVPSNSISFETKSLSPFVSTFLPTQYLSGSGRMPDVQWLRTQLEFEAGMRVPEPKCEPTVLARHRDTQGDFFTVGAGAGAEPLFLHCVEDAGVVDGVHFATWRVANNTSTAQNISLEPDAGAKIVAYDLPGNVMLDLDYIEDAAGMPRTDTVLAPGASIDVRVPAGTPVRIFSEENVERTYTAFLWKSVGDVIDLFTDSLPAVEMAQTAFFLLDSCIYGPGTSGVTVETILQCVLSTEKAILSGYVRKLELDGKTPQQVRDFAKKITKAFTKVTLVADALVIAGELYLQRDATQGTMHFSPGPRITSTALSTGTLAAAYEAELTTADDRAGVWQTGPGGGLAGSLPPGLSLSGNKVVGIPKKSGSYRFSVRFTDAKGDSDTRVVSMDVSSDGVGNVVAGRASTGSDGTGDPVKDVIAFAILDGDIADSATTDADGYYLIDSLEPGTYSVCFDTSHAATATREQYADQCYRGTAWDSLDLDVTAATTVDVSSDFASEGIDAVLSQGGSISGFIRDENGAPFPGVEILVDGVSGSWRSREDGTYLIEDIQPGFHTVCFGGVAGGQSRTGALSTCYYQVPRLPDDVNGLRGGATRVGVRADTKTQGVDAVLKTAAAVTGRVVDGAGAPVVGVTVVARRFGKYVGQATSDEAGRYRMGGLPALTGLAVCSQYFFIERDDAPYGLAPACADQGVDTQLGQTSSAGDIVMPAAGGMSGTITSSVGAPLTNVSVYVPTGDEAYLRTETDGSGRWRVLGLAPQAYSACFDARSARPDLELGYASECHRDLLYRPAMSRLGSGDDIDVEAGLITTGVDAVLALGGGISGTVLGPDDEAVRYARIDVRSGGETIHSTLTSSIGSFRVTGLAAGAYRVCYLPNKLRGSDEDSTFVSSPSGLGYLDVCGDPIEVKAHASTVADRVLREGGAITGSVTASDGPVSSRVEVLDESGFRVGSAPVRFGGFSVQGLATGSYSVCVVPVAAAHADNGGRFVPACVGTFAEYGTPVDDEPVGVAVGAVTDIGTLAIPDAVTVTGRVSQSDGAPIFGAKVRYQGVIATTNGLGEYRLSARPGTGPICVASADSDASGRGYAGSCAELAGASGDEKGVDFTLESWMTARISGVVRDTGRSRLKDVSVRLIDEEGDVTREQSTGSDGTFAFGALRPGDYGLCFVTDISIGGASEFGYMPECFDDREWDGRSSDFSDLTLLTIAGGEDIELDVDLLTASSIAGSVTFGADEPAYGAVAHLFTESGDALDSMPVSESGAYRFDNLRPGRYQLCFDGTDVGADVSTTGVDDECLGDVAWAPPGPGAGSFVTLGEAELVTADAVLDQLVRLQGTVTSTSGGPADGIEVLLFGEQESAASVDAITDSTGAWAIRRLDPGVYRVCFRSPSNASATYVPECFDDVEWTDQRAYAEFSSPVELAPGDVGTVNAALDPSARIAGSVIDANGAAVEDVLVTLTKGSSTVSLLMTSADGSFEFERLEAGSYELCFEPSDTATSRFLNECYDNDVWFDSRPHTVDTVDVTSGQNRVLAQVVLTRAGVARGRVTIPNGDPASGVLVAAYDSTGTLVHQGWTTSEGDYELLLPEGPTVLCFTPAFGEGLLRECHDDVYWELGQGLPSAADNVTISASTPTTVDAVLNDGGEISGLVTDSRQAAVPGVYVQAFDSEGHVARVASTDETGAFTLDRLLPGDYRVCFETDYLGADVSLRRECYDDVSWTGSGGAPAQTSTVLAVGAGDRVHDVDAQLEGAYRLRGTVLDAVSSDPVPGAHIRVFTMNGEFVAGASSSDDGAFVSQPLTEGAYLVCVEGHYAVTQDAPAGYAGQCADGIAWDGGEPAAGSQSVSVGPNAAPVSFSLARAAGISGSVTDADATPLTDAQVYVARAGDRTVITSVFSTDGSYRLGGLTEGDYIVCASARDVTEEDLTRSFSAECFEDVTWPDGESIPPGATAISLEAGVVTPIAFALDSTETVGGRVAGVVRDDESRPLGGVEVVAKWQISMFEYRVKTTTTASDGSYAVKGLPEGPVKVCFDGTRLSSEAAPGGYQYECFDNATGMFDDPGTDVAVVAGETSQVDAELVPDTVISGRVVSTDGGAIRDAQVRAVRENAGGSLEFLGWAVTDQQGRYALHGLKAGPDVVVCVESPDPGSAPDQSPGGYIAECFDDQRWTTGAPPAAATRLIVVERQRLADIDFELVEGGAITGQVTDDHGVALRNVSLQVISRTPEQQRFSTRMYHDGSFVVPGLPAGDYVVCVRTDYAEPVDGVRPAQGYADECFDDVPFNLSLTDPTPITVVAGQTTPDVDFALEPGATLRGTVTGAGSPAAQPLESVYVTLYSADGDLVDVTFTDAAGEFELVGRSPGQYVLCFEGTESGHGSECWDDVPYSFDQPLPADADLVTLAAGEEAKVEAVLSVLP